MFKSFILILFFAIVFIGCSVKYEGISLDENDNIVVEKFDSDAKDNIDKLTNMILSISSKITYNEAYEIAYKSTYYAMYLANKYDIVKPPMLQNFLVNENVREYGLCYHWANDMIVYLKKSRYPNIDIYKAVANNGQYFEHNAIVITARNDDFQNGIILDAWRNSGKLFYSYVRDDKSYDWKSRIKVKNSQEK